MKVFSYQCLSLTELCYFADEIRQDIEDAVSHMKPWLAENGSTYFGGWARMAQPIVDFNIVEVMLIAIIFNMNTIIGYI